MIILNKIILCKLGRVPACTLNGVDYDTINYTSKFNDLDEISFTVDKYIDMGEERNIVSSGYDLLHAFMEIYVEGIGYFQIKEPQISNDGDRETKTVTGVSTACELLQKDLVGFTVNKTTANSLEMLADNNINSLGYPNEYITFYNKNNPQLSLIDLVLEKASGWGIGFIDDYLKEQRFVFENINENIFSFLTKTLSSTARCIFYFDTVNKTISAYSESNIGQNTGIVIAYRNLLNKVDVSCDSDNIFTRLNVQGKDSLTFADINYGDTHVFNLDYYKNTNYMDSELIDKLDIWEQSRNDNREDYISKTKNYHNYVEQISEIDNKVPNNGVLNNWDNMSMDELIKNQTYYNSLIKSFQITAQNTHPQGSETIYTGNLDDYTPSRLKSDGTVDHEAYMADLDGQGKETYREIITYVLPNIQIAIDNFDKTATEKSDYLTGYLTEWDLYGIVELKAKQSAYEDQINTLKEYAKNWDGLTDEEKKSHGGNQANYNLYHNEYIKIDGYLTDIAFKLTELEEQKQALIMSRDAIQSELKQIRIDMAITGGRTVNGTYINWFTDDEIELINLLFHDNDYTNENILITSLDDFNRQIEIEQELYEDAMAQLEELSTSQYSFSCEIDNLLDIDEFKVWKDDFKVGNFITLEVSLNCFTKLRLISISYNPCIKTNDLTVEFSNMVSTKSGRNDFSYIFDKAISVAKNSITYSNNSNKDSIELSTELLNLLSNSSVFQGKFDNLELKNLTTNEAQIVNLTADYAKINELEAVYATIDFANITEAAISRIQAIDIDASKITTGTLIADRILLKAPAGSESEGLLYAINNFGDLTSTSVDTIDGYILTERTINADKIIASSITTNELDVNQIFANSAVLSTLTAQQAFINAISTNTVVVGASQQASQALGIANTANENVNKSVSSIIIHYLVTSVSSGVTTDTTGWTTTPQSMTSDKKYLWTYQTMTDIAGNSTNSTPVISGVYGDKGETGQTGATGTSVTKAIPLYYASNSIISPNAPTSAVVSTSTSANVWTTIQPAFSKSYPYIYVCTQVEFSDNTYSWSNVTIERNLSLMANWCSANDVTLLDGGKIYTGSITADKIQANSLTSEQIATGSITIGALSNSIQTSINRIDNLNIGGANISTGTANMIIGTGGYNKGRWRKSGTGNLENTTISDFSGIFYGIKLEITNESSQVAVVQDNVPLDKGEQYIVSFWARCLVPDASCIVGVQGFNKSGDSDSSKNFTVTSDWTRISYQFIKKPNTTSTYTSPIIALRASSVGTSVEICGIKLEKGNLPTAWGISDVDINNSILDASIVNWCYNNNKTYIDGAKIYTGTITTDKISANAITAEKIATDAIKSTNYVANTSGSFLNLSDGSWDSKNFKIDTTGNITATGGTLGGWDFDGKIMKKLLINGTTDKEKRYVFINTQVTTGSWDGSTLASPKGRVLGVNSAIDEYIDTQTAMGTAGALYVNADGSISATSLDKKSTFSMSDGNIYLTQTKELAGQSEYTYSCWMQGNVLTFCKLNDGKYPKTGFLYLGEMGNLLAGTLGIRGVKGLCSDTEDINILTGGNLILRGSQITSSQPITVASDARVKNHIDSLPKGSENLFDYLDGKSFFYNNSVSTQKSYGFIAQDVLSALTSAGLTTDDFAGFCDINGDGSQYALAYEQFIPIMWNEIKRLRKQVKELKGDYNA